MEKTIHYCADFDVLLIVDKFARRMAASLEKSHLERHTRGPYFVSPSAYDYIELRTFSPARIPYTPICKIDAITPIATDEGPSDKVLGEIYIGFSTVYPDMATLEPQSGLCLVFEGLCDDEERDGYLRSTFYAHASDLQECKGIEQAALDWFFAHITHKFPDTLREQNPPQSEQAAPPDLTLESLEKRVRDLEFIHNKELRGVRGYVER